MSVRKALFLFLLTGTFLSCLCVTLKRSEILDVNGKYLVDWDVDFEKEMIVFTLDVETTGFVGFGISMNPNMEGADIVIGGVSDDDGQTYFAVIYLNVPLNEGFQLEIFHYLGLSCYNKWKSCT